MGSFVDAGAAIDFEFSSPPFSWTYTAADDPDTLALGDVVLMFILSDSSAGHWSFGTVPGDWTQLFGLDIASGAPASSFFVFAKAWGSLDDQSTYTAEWIAADSNLEDSTFNCWHCLGADGDVTPGGSAVSSELFVETTFSYPPSDVTLDMHIDDASVAQVDLSVGSVGSVYAAGGFGESGTGIWTPDPPFLETRGLGGASQLYVAGYLAAPPPTPTIRASHRVGQHHRLGVS